MAGFDWNVFYSLFKTKIGNICTVGRYKIPKEAHYPYLDINLADNSGGNYDLECVENTQIPMIEINVYCNNYDDAKCYEISMKVKEIMLSYGFKCKTAPIKISSADVAIARWVSRYQRIFGINDILQVGK